jgi:sulfite exporter TauE/SafE
MAFFGLGTIPVMWSIAFFGSSLNMKIRLKIKKLYPYVMFLMAILLIVRGLGLEIPFMSPVINQAHSLKQATISCHD